MSSTFAERETLALLGPTSALGPTFTLVRATLAFGAALALGATAFMRRHAWAARCCSPVDVGCSVVQIGIGDSQPRWVLRIWSYSNITANVDGSDVNGDRGLFLEW